MAKTKTISQSQYEHLAAFRYALRQFLHFSEEAARAAGLTPVQHQALLAIKGFQASQEQMTMSELAEQLQLRHHSAVGLVDRLVSSRLAIRESLNSDRRFVLVKLTSRGERILEKLASAHEEELRRIGPQLRALLRKLTS
ncbi:MAG TPA: MarR family transcriptional regulator [Candidatus Dormibacteraeota bacterium]|nr:MarR family transcriptional regulator [Candidatus Dormibacteraeota bacterium]